MANFDTFINREKKAYLDFAKENSGKELYIYGAGRMAKPLLKLYEKNNIHVSGFVVQCGSDNKHEECGVPIIEISELENRDVAIAIGVNARLNSEVETALDGLGLHCYLKPTKYLRYFGDYQCYFYNNPMMEITTQIGCAVNCRFCPQSVLLKSYYKTGKEKKKMSLEVFKECIDKLPLNTLIEFAGFTEPFYNQDCAKMIEYAKQKGFKINLFTTLIDVGVTELRMIKETEFEELVIHVPDEEGYASIPITDEYIRKLDELLSMKKQNGEDFVEYICSQGTIHPQIREVVNGRARVYVSLLDRAGNLDDEGLFSSSTPEGSVLCELSDSLNHNVLLPNGDMVLCAQDYALKHVLGNLLNQSYDAIMNGDEINRILEAQKNNGKCICRECSLAHIGE